MESDVTYGIVVVLSIVVAFLGFATEITESNILHVKNGREPNAGAAIFPGIPFIPLVTIGLVWAIDWIYPHLGFGLFMTLFCLFVPYWWFNIRRSDKQLRALIAEKAEQSGLDNQADT
jgi:hypothetical protein